MCIRFSCSRAWLSPARGFRAVAQRGSVGVVVCGVYACDAGDVSLYVAVCVSLCVVCGGCGEEGWNGEGPVGDDGGGVMARVCRVGVFPGGAGLWLFGLFPLRGEWEGSVGTGFPVCAAARPSLAFAWCGDSCTLCAVVVCGCVVVVAQ